MLGEGLALANTAYQLYRDKITRNREDTAYQRAAYDMRQAGLNPLLHSVNPAQASPGPQDTGVNSALQQRLISSQIALQNSQALASAVTSARELATTFKEAGINIGGMSLGGKINSRNNSAMVEYMNSMLGAVGLGNLRFRGNAVAVPKQAPASPPTTLAPASAKEQSQASKEYKPVDWVNIPIPVPNPAIAPKELYAPIAPPFMLRKRK